MSVANLHCKVKGANQIVCVNLAGTSAGVYHRIDEGSGLWYRFMDPDALSSSTMTSFYIQSRTNNCGPLSMGDPRTHLFVQIDATNLTDSCKLLINGHSTTTGMFPLFQKDFVPPPFPKYCVC
ncbi:hypothetical protein WAI453_011573 [Rhynchosporium graminicola]